MPNARVWPGGKKPQREAVARRPVPLPTSNVAYGEFARLTMQHPRTMGTGAPPPDRSAPLQHASHPPAAPAGAQPPITFSHGAAPQHQTDPFRRALARFGRPATYYGSHIIQFP